MEDKMNGTTERKKSDSSEISSPKAPTDASSKSAKGNDLADLQKKMKILKDALVKERQEKEGALKAKKEIDKELERIKGVVQEKESFLLRLKEEATDLQAKLQIEKKKNDAQKTQDGQQANLTDMLSSSISGLSGMLGMGMKKEPSSPAPTGPTAEDLQKLKNDHAEAKKQILAMKEKYLKTETIYEQVRKDARQQAENSQKKIKEIEKDLESRVQAYKELEQKFEEVNRTIIRLRKDKETLEEEISRIRAENELFSNERDDLEKEHAEKSKIVDELKEVHQKMKTELDKQSDKVSKITNQLDDANTNLRVFDVKKIYKGIEIPTQILMRKTVTGEYLIEIENDDERLALTPYVVQSFGLVDGTEDRFSFDYKNQKGTLQKDTYKAADRKRILKSLKTFVKLAEENKIKNNTKEKIGREKNLLTQMVSFFNN